MAILSFEQASERRFDMTGATISVVCALHCLLTPVMLASIPAMAATVGDLEFMHPIFILMALPIAALSMHAGLKRHAKRLPSALATLGLSLMTAALFVEGPILEPAVTSAGSLLVLIAHLSNNRLCANCPTCASTA